MKDSFGSGKYYYFRDHSTPEGWGVKLTESKNGSDITIAANVCDKTYAALIADLLNKYGSNYEFLEMLELEVKKNYRNS